MGKEIREMIDKVKNFKEFLNESINDATKLKFIGEYYDLFFNYCKKNTKKIIDTLFEDAYYEFKIKDVNVIITIDELITESGGVSLGQYSDENKELTISLYSPLRKIKYGSRYIGLSQVDDLSEIDEDELEIIKEITIACLTNQSNEFAKNVKSVFIHEMTHHWDNINYGIGFQKNVSDLEGIRNNISIEKSDTYYWNMHHETNAKIIQALDGLLDNHGNKFGDFNIFYELFLNYFPMYYKMDAYNQKKVQKRAFKFFNDYLNKT